jgi:predicted transcriptional regulator
MKKTLFTTMLMILGLALFSGCATMHVWPDHERSAENKMVAIEGKIGDGLKTGALTPDQVQMFLTTLKGLRTEYEELRNRTVYQERWTSLHDRLDMLADDIDRASSGSAAIGTPMFMDRILIVQRNIDEGRISGRLPYRKEREFQDRLDAIRRDSLRMTDGGRTAGYDEREDISRRLDALARDLDRYR